MSRTGLDDLLGEIRAYCVREQHLDAGSRPIVQAGGSARIMIVGQARDRRVPRHQRRLRKHPWFEADALPAIRARVHEVVAGSPGEG